MLSIRVIILIVLTSMFSIASVFAVHLGGNDLPWGQPMTHKLDKPLNDKYKGKCFFMNLGPTGIRARIYPQAPKEFKVMYVFQDAKSPAKGKVDVGDIIIGANGKMFQKAHGFHRKKAGSRGWQGPPFELAHAIEDSQGKDGKLTLMVLKGGRKAAKKNVVLQLKKVGRFSKTYPWDCDRSEKLRKHLVDFMLETGVHGPLHYRIQQTLALWASGDRRAIPIVKNLGKSLSRSRANPAQTGMCTWGWGYSGIFLGEYYNAFKDKEVVPAAEALANAFELGMNYVNGGFSHRPEPFIIQRASDTGIKGYGAMAGPGGLSMLAQSLFRASGLPYSERSYQRTHAAYLQQAQNNPRAAIAYGMNGGWPTYIIRLLDPKTPCKSGKGNGYICPTGMKGIGKFIVEKWTQSSGKWKMDLVPSSTFPQLFKNQDSFLVYETNIYVDPSVKQRRVIIPLKTPEPTKPYTTLPGGGGHCAPMGMGAAAHFIGNEGNKSWNYLGQHYANGCALSPGMLFDGHADATMHAFYSVIGALRAEKRHLRTYLDYIKTLIVLSETHDGGLVEQPFGCQRNSTCSIARNRTAYTHIAVLLLSLPKRNLLITGRRQSMVVSNRKNNPIYYSIQSADYIIKYCKKEIAALEKGRGSYSSILRSLDKYAKKDNAKGKEAKIFSERMKKLIANRQLEILEASKEKPVGTLGDLEDYYKLVKELGEGDVLKARIAVIKKLPGTSELVKIYKNLESIEKKIAKQRAKKRPSKSAVESAERSKKRIVEKLEKSIGEGEMDASVKAEAEALLNSLKEKVARL